MASLSISLPTYTRHERPLLGRRWRIRAIVTTGLRREFRRPAAQFAIGIGATITALTAILTALVFSFFPGAQEVDLAYFFGTASNPTILFFITLLAAVVGSALIADDVGSMALTLYLSRPISHLDYLLAKAAILFPLVAMVGIFPLVLTPFLAALLGVATWEVGLQAVAVGAGVGILLTAFYAAVSLFLSSITRRKSYAGAGVFGVTFGLTAPIAILRQVTGNDALLYLSPWDNFLAVAAAAYGATSPPVPPIDWPPALAILLGVTVVASLATYLRMKVVEVVSG